MPDESSLSQDSAELAVGAAYAVPRLYVVSEYDTALLTPLRQHVGLYIESDTPVEVEYSCLGVPVRVPVFVLTKEGVAHLMSLNPDHGDSAHHVRVRVHGRECTIVCSRKAEVLCDELTPFGDRKALDAVTGLPAESLTRRTMFDFVHAFELAIRDVLTLLGVQSLVCMCGQHISYVPLPVEPGRLHLLFSVVPYAEHAGEYPDKIADVDLCIDETYTVLLRPNPDRGLLVYVDSLVVAQIINHTIYFLYDPLVLVKHDPIRGARVFAHMFVSALVTWRNKTEEAHLEEVTREGLMKHCGEMEQEMLNLVRQAEKDVLRAQTVLTQATRRHAQHGMLLRTWRQHADTLVARISSDIDRLQALPLVSRVTQTKQVPAIEVATKTICMNHEGVNYDLGEFSIRILFLGKIEIVALRTTHPEGVPHPHISMYGTPCFGNVSDAVTSALAEYRYCDLVSCVLSWLTEGYTPELIVVHPIEEWPRLITNQGVSA